MQTITIKGEGISLDLLLWRRYGKAGQNLLSEVFNLNPGLAAKGYDLPLGTVVIVPELPVSETKPRPVVDLFGG